VLVAVVSATLAWQLNQQKEFAQQQERVAMEQSDLAIEALGDMVLEVQNELEDTPGALPARMAILQRVMKNLERLNDTPATSDRVRRKHILAHMQIADIHWELADRPKAHEEYVVAFDLARKAFEADPASDKAKSNMLSMATKLGESELYYLQHVDDARRRYEFAVRGWEELAEKM